MSRVSESLQRSASLGAAGLELEAMAAIALHEDARETRRRASEERRDAQRDKILLMRQSAAKLRELASCALGSALWQGVLGIAGAACSRLDALARVLDVAKNVDGFGLRGQLLSAAKAGIDAQAEAAGQQAQERGDLESEARRLEQAAAQQLQKLGEARHAAAIAALRV